MALADHNASVAGIWHLDEASGNALATVGGDLTDNATVGSAAGLLSNARDFEAANSEYFNAADASWNSMGDIAVTIAAWVQLESTGSNRSVVFKEDGSTGDYYIYYHNSTSRFRFGVNYSAEVTASNFGAPSTGVWYLLVATHDPTANEIGISVNAGTANTAAHTTGITDSATVFRVGNDFYSNYFDGLMDELIIWKGVVLNSSERTELYNGGAGIAYPFTVAGKAKPVHRRRRFERRPAA